jgi:N-acetylmuramic acid 6-phosphate etherase
MLERLLTEQSNPSSSNLGKLDSTGILTLMNSADADVAPAVAREIPRIAAAVDAIAAALDQGGSLIYLGAGTSGRLGVLDAAECPPTFHTPPRLVRAIIAGGDVALRRAVEGAEDDPEAGARDVIEGAIRPGDVLVGITASGRTPYVLGAVAEARRLGVVTCGISCTPDSELSRAVDFPIEPVTGPEILTGSTRLRAGTATKLVLNMISTATMVRLGYVYQNLMVNVQPSNRKLEDRARRIVQQAAGVTFESACELLDQAGRSVRTAIVMARKGVDREQAEKLLAAARGRLADVVD